MNVSLLFACGLILTAAVALTVVRYLHGPLKKQLQELCGNAERAEFWAAFSKVTVVLTPVVFSMLVEPSLEPGVPPLLAVINRLKWGLIGLVISVLMLGWILSRFLPRTSVAPPDLIVERKVEGRR